MVFKGIWTPVFSFLKKKYDFNEKKAMEKARFEPAELFLSGLFFPSDEQ